MDPYARIDQAQSHLIMLAETWGLMHKKLVELGVPKETAKEIIVNWVHNTTMNKFIEEEGN